MHIRCSRMNRQRHLHLRHRSRLKCNYLKECQDDPLPMSSCLSESQLALVHKACEREAERPGPGRKQKCFLLPIWLIRTGWKLVARVQPLEEGVVRIRAWMNPIGADGVTGLHRWLMTAYASSPNTARWGMPFYRIQTQLLS